MTAQKPFNGMADAHLLSARVTYDACARSFKRAQRRHDREQERGASDISVRQTRKMYFAAEALRRAGFALATAEQSVKFWTRKAGE